LRRFKSIDFADGQLRQATGHASARASGGAWPWAGAGRAAGSARGPVPVGLRCSGAPDHQGRWELGGGRFPLRVLGELIVIAAGAGGAIGVWALGREPRTFCKAAPRWTPDHTCIYGIVRHPLQTSGIQ